MLLLALAVGAITDKPINLVSVITESDEGFVNSTLQSQHFSRSDSPGRYLLPS